MQTVPAFFLAGIRHLASGIILVAYFLLSGQLWPDWRTLGRSVLQGLLLLFISNGLMTRSMKHIDSGLAAIVAALIPLWIALFSRWLIPAARFSPLFWTGLALGFGGVLLIFREHLADMEQPGFALGILAAVSATLIWAAGSVLVSRQHQDIPPLFNAGLQMLCSGVVLVPLCIATGNSVSLMQIPQSAWISILYLVFIGTLLSYTAYIYTMANLPPAKASVYAYINPLVAVILGCVVLHEKLNAGIGSGTVVTLAGVYLVHRSGKQKTY